MAEVAYKLVSAGAVGINTASHITVNIIIPAGSNRASWAHLSENRPEAIEEAPSPNWRLDGYRAHLNARAVSVSL